MSTNSKKRGPNSPMESEKAKQSTSSAATSTLGMAALFSAASHVFSRQSNEAITDSEDDFQSQAEVGNGSENGGQSNPWNEANLRKSNVKSPKKRPDSLFEHYYSDGARRDEIEIEFNTKNGKKFSGSITPLEVKHGIYIDMLGFEDHSNFDGVRIGFKGKLIATIKLINPIDIDELCSVEYFDYIRTSTYRGKRSEETIGCKIRGVRLKQPTSSAFETEQKDESKTLVKIEGCEHRIPKDQILAWLSLYGTVASDLEEDFFVDTKETEAINRTGNYSVLMELDYKIPQLIPMAGRRIKIYHKGIDKLCTKCFGKHRKSDCKEQSKVEWIDYVANFITTNPDIPTEFYGRWTELVAKNQQGLLNKNRTSEQPQRSQKAKENTESSKEDTQETSVPEPQTTETGEKIHAEKEAQSQMDDTSLPPTEGDFDLPMNEEQYESMVDRFATIGLKRPDLDKVLESRRTAFNKALREYKVAERKKKADELKANKKPRKNSIAK